MLMMEAIMLGGGHKLEIFDSIVERVAVYVMNVLHSGKRATEMLFHNPSVLLHRLFADANLLVGAIFPFRMAFSIGSISFVRTWAAVTSTFRRTFSALATEVATFHDSHHVTRNII
jgi:hypothetical protein